jgi:hypothetical protein
VNGPIAAHALEGGYGVTIRPQGRGQRFVVASKYPHDLNPMREPFLNGDAGRCPGSGSKSKCDGVNWMVQVRNDVRNDDHPHQHSEKSQNKRCPAIAASNERGAHRAHRDVDDTRQKNQNGQCGYVKGHSSSSAWQ